MMQCASYHDNRVNPINSQSNHMNHNAQQQDFSKIFYQFTHKIDLSSSKIVDFYDNFLTKKLDLAEQHIEQISKLTMLQKPRKRVENPTAKQIQQENEAQQKQQQLKKVKMNHNEQKSQKKIFDEKFMNDLSKDLLQLDLDFMDDDVFEQSSQKQRQSHKNSSQRFSSKKLQSQTSQTSNNQAAFSVKINGQDMQGSAIKGKKNPNEQEEEVYANTNNDIFKTRMSRKSQKEQQMVNENSIKKGNTLEVVNAKGKCRKSLIDQFSEIKVKGKQEIQNEKQSIQEQVEQINIEDFCQAGINPSFCQMQPERSNQSNGNNESCQESLLLPKSSMSSSDGQIQLNFNDNEEFLQGNSMQPQQLPDGFYIHGNNHILLEEDEDEHGYEMTDYSSNESSNMGSPVFNWVNKEEQVNDKLYFNNDQYSSQQNNNMFNIPSNKYNSKNQNIFETTSSSHQSNSNENSKTFNNNPQFNQDYFSQNTFGFGFNQPIFLDDNSNSSEVNFKNPALYSQDSFQGMNFLNNNSSKQQDIFASSQGNSNMFISMNNDSNSANPYNQLNKKLLYSPQKLKTVKQRKILYCNNKEVPSWAQDLSKVTQKVREQKERGDDPIKLFGLFAVESLQLREVFKNTGKRYDEGRGSSANWRQDYTPDQMMELINATSQTPNKKQKMQSKFKSFLQNSFNSIKKKLIQ